MRLITLLNHCHHFPGFVYQKARLCPERGIIEIDMRPRRGAKPVCSGCHRPAAGYDHLGLRRFEFVPFWGFAVLFIYHMRRVDCRVCGVRVEELPWAIGKHQLTKAYMLFLAHWARQLSWQETAVAFRTSWDKVCQAVEYVVDWGLEHRPLGPIQAIGVDEIQYAKGHKYLTLVYQIEQGCIRLLWIGKDRTTKSFEQFFTLIGKQLSEGIQFVCSDMWKPYLRVVRERCTNAVNILDRFHIVAKMNEALDDVRAAEARRLAQDGYQPVLKKTRWCVLKRKANLTSRQRFRLRDLLRYNLKTVRAYLLKEDFQQFWELQLADLGRQVPRRLVRAGHALAHRADEEGRQHAARPPRTHPQLFPRQKTVLQRRRRGPQQQGQTDHAKSLRIPHLPHHRNRSLSRPRKATGA